MSQIQSGPAVLRGWLDAACPRPIAVRSDGASVARRIHFRLPCWEVLVMLAICSADMVSSAYLFHQHLAVEANPLLRPYAEAGLLPFLAVKMLTFVPALAVAEWYVRRNPAFIKHLLRMAIVAYVGIYLLSVAGQLADQVDGFTNAFGTHRVEVA